MQRYGTFFSNVELNKCSDGEYVRADEALSKLKLLETELVKVKGVLRRIVRVYMVSDESWDPELKTNETLERLLK